MIVGLINSYCYNGCNTNIPIKSGGEQEGITCYDVCSGEDYCVSKINTQVPTLNDNPNSETLIRKYCRDINNDITNISPSNQFSIIQKNDFGSCSIL